jgi:hypothetical protein
VGLVACGDSATTADSTDTTAEVAGDTVSNPDIAPDLGDVPDVPLATGAWVTWNFDNEVFLVDPTAATPTPTNVSALIDGVVTRPSDATDRWLVPSPTGAIFAVSSDLATGDGEVLVVLDKDFQSAVAVKIDGSPIYLEGLPAITDEGTLVFAASGGPHALDLYASARLTDTTWATPTLLTNDSTYAHNNMPSLSRDGGSVLFNCGAERDPESGSNDACIVSLTGSDFTVVVTHTTLADGRNSYVNFPRDAGNGRVVFEGSWPQDGGGDETPPETIWQRTGSTDPTPAVTRTFDNSVSPCALADGSLVVLWLGRPGQSGGHELTHIKTDGSFTTLTPGMDVSDIGIGCTNRPL